MIVDIDKSSFIVRCVLKTRPPLLQTMSGCQPEKTFEVQWFLGNTRFLTLYSPTYPNIFDDLKDSFPSSVNIQRTSLLRESSMLVYDITGIDSLQFNGESFTSKFIFDVLNIYEGIGSTLFGSGAIIIETSYTPAVLVTLAGMLIKPPQLFSSTTSLVS